MLKVNQTYAVTRARGTTRTHIFTHARGLLNHADSVK